MVAWSHHMMKSVLCLLIVFMAACKTPKMALRQQLDLSGAWQFSLDSLDGGIRGKWFTKGLSDSIILPGTTDIAKKGKLNNDSSTMHLTRLYPYEGAAWYRKKITVPKSFAGRHLQLMLERTKYTTIWIDDKLVGSSSLLQSAQYFDVTQYLDPGDHHITIHVNNDLKLTPFGNVHIYSDDTQTNWNGIIGTIQLEASDPLHISNMQVFPDIAKKQAIVKLEISNPGNITAMEIALHMQVQVDGQTKTLPVQKHTLPYGEEISLPYTFDEPIALWDEFNQPLYTVRAELLSGNHKDELETTFGMRQFATRNKQFTINEKTIFLRGKHDACVFPATGHPPMDTEGWRRVYRIAKTYGINHYRFHSYCPPEAAFAAADIEGIYLQAELPFWGGLESDTVANMLLEEGKAMQRAYGNHPSFVMLSPGNEIWGGHEKVDSIMHALLKNDSRQLYTMGSNNNIGYLPPRDYSDYFIGARVPGIGGSTVGHTRLTHAFADADAGGILNTFLPATNYNFDSAVAHMPLPLISHEIGQYQVYPYYKEIDKYTGPLRPYNFDIFRRRLTDNGLKGMDSIFQKASGAWAAICYKAEMEAALRTPHMAGFQLLDLQDFPGQGTALVGMLDAFMDSKNVVTPDTWKQSCNDVVLLASVPKFVYTQHETLNASIMVANYSTDAINDGLQWQLTNTSGEIVAKGNFADKQMPQGGLFSMGEIAVTLPRVDQGQKLALKLWLTNHKYQNEYPLWLYPKPGTINIPAGIAVAETLSPQQLQQLEKGGKILLFPKKAAVAHHAVDGLFTPDFWNYGMFKTISESNKKPVSPGTLGLLMNPLHPIFKLFPTDFHTNWQWFSMIKAGSALRLINTSADVKPIVQVIDNLERNNKLGMIMECKVAKGRLLICMSPLHTLTENAAAQQLYRSIVSYMSDDKLFDPSEHFTAEQIQSLLFSQTDTN